MLVSRSREFPIRLWFKWVSRVGVLGVSKVIFNTEGPSKGCYVVGSLFRLGAGGVGTKPRPLESADIVA